jgi:hypothetical protein
MEKHDRQSSNKHARRRMRGSDFIRLLGFAAIEGSGRGEESVSAG